MNTSLKSIQIPDCPANEGFFYESGRGERLDSIAILYIPSKRLLNHVTIALHSSLMQYLKAARYKAFREPNLVLIASQFHSDGQVKNVLNVPAVPTHDINIS